VVKFYIAGRTYHGADIYLSIYQWRHRRIGVHWLWNRSTIFRETAWTWQSR
jgi:hypothetical protein